MEDRLGYLNGTKVIIAGVLTESRTLRFWKIRKFLGMVYKKAESTQVLQDGEVIAVDDCLIMNARTEYQLREALKITIPPIS